MTARPHRSRLNDPRMPLSVPASMLAHLVHPEAQAREAAALAGMLAPYEGFEYGTFQIVEHDAGTTPGFNEVGAFDDWPAPDLEWQFVLCSVLDAFLAAGLDEIDVQMYLQYRLGAGSHALRAPWPDFAPGLGARPAGLLAVPGIEMAAFGFEVTGRRNIPPARRWLAEVFIPHWIDPVVRAASTLPRHFVQLGFLDLRPT